MLQQLPKAMGKAVLRRALMKAGAPIANAMRLNAPHGAPDFIGPRRKTLAQSIAISTKLKSSQQRFRRFSGSEVVVYVGSTAPHAHLYEFGTVMRKTQTGKSTGRMPANPFARTAWDSTKHEALRILSFEVEVELLKAVKRLRRRAERGTIGKRQTMELLG